MSFISILKKIGSTALGIEHAASPLLSVLLPGSAPILAVVDSLVAKVQASIITTEANDPRDGVGKIKAEAVVADLDSYLELAQSALSIAKQKLVYDEAKLQAAISAQVSAYNAFAELKASFKVVPIS